MKKRRTKKVIKRRGRIDKRKLIFLIVVAALVFFLIFKMASGIKNTFFKNKEASPATKNTQSSDLSERNTINIAIDPARGGENKGLKVLGGNLHEKDINLEIAKKIKENLSTQKDVNVFLTRNYDEDMEVPKRVKLAKTKQADLLISIRLNGQSGGSDANGIDTYYSDPKEKPSIVDNSNDSNTSNNDKISDISNSKDKTNSSTSSNTSTSTSSNTSTSKSTNSNTGTSTESNKGTTKPSSESKRSDLGKLLATSVQNTTLSFVDMTDRGILKNQFDVLKYTEMPAVIVQCGFVTNKKDGEKLESDKYQSDIADGISEGILQFIDKKRNLIIQDRINYR